MSRVTRSREEARASYDRISGWYDLLEGLWENKSRDRGLNKLNVREGEKVLDIGCGTGEAVVALAKSVGASGKVCGVDISPRMLRIAAGKVHEAGLDSRVDLELGDALTLPYDAGVFAAVFMSFTLELFDTPEIPLVLQECRRVLRRTGRICIVSLSKAGAAGRMRDIYEWGHRRFPKFLDCRPIFVRAALEENGFAILDATRATILTMPVEIVLAARRD
jgi:ubiquinone/menaquinone biosynthesis C-methylase UbiE